MRTNVNPANALRMVKDLLYRGRLQDLLTQAGLADRLYDPYWRLAYRLSGDELSQTVGDQEVFIRPDTRTEFERFTNLAEERAILENLLQSVGPDDVVYDIGANIGMYTCFIASKLGSSRTVAFEPEPRNAERLRENLQLNNLDPQVVEVALSNANGTTDLTLASSESGEGEHAIATGESTQTIEVEMGQGDMVIDRRNLPVPSIVKIDVEGAEVSVLRGFQEALRDHIRLVYVEVHPEKVTEFGNSPPEAREILEDLGFNVTKLDSRGSEFHLRASK